MKQVRNVKIVGDKLIISKKEKLCAIFSYLVFGLIWYLIDRDFRRSDYVTFHVKQSLIIILGSFLIQTAVSIVGLIIPFLDKVAMLGAVKTVILFYYLSGIVIALIGRMAILPGLKGFFKYLKF